MHVVIFWVKINKITTNAEHCQTLLDSLRSSNISASIFWLTPHKFGMNFSHFLWQSRPHSATLCILKHAVHASII